MISYVVYYIYLFYCYDNDGKKAYRLNIVNIKTWKETVRLAPNHEILFCSCVLNGIS